MYRGYAVEALRNMWGRKLRMALTIFGIVTGIFAFAVMGSVAQNIKLLISDALGFYGSAINVQAKVAVVSAARSPGMWWRD